MSNIVTYRMEKDDFRHPILVEEESMEYDGSRIENPKEAVNLVNEVFRLKYLAEEQVILISMDTKGHILGLFRVSQGTVDKCLCNPREVFIRALVTGASSVILVHNHPSGDASPSEMDYHTCQRNTEVSNILGVYMNDFIIVGDDYYSFREHNELSLI